SWILPHNDVWPAWRSPCHLPPGEDKTTQSCRRSDGGRSGRILFHWRDRTTGSLLHVLGAAAVSGSRDPPWYFFGHCLCHGLDRGLRLVRRSRGLVALRAEPVGQSVVDAAGDGNSLFRCLPWHLLCAHRAFQP